MADQIEIFNIEFGDTFDSINKLKAELKETKKLFNDAKPNTPEFTKYSNEVKRLDGSIKLLNNTTKDQVNALGGINKSTQFASGSYGELKQKIDQQTRALNNLTVGSEDFNQAQEELIKLQAQRIEIERKIPSLFQERIKLAVDEANTLKSLRAELKAANSAALNGDGKAAARAAELRDKLEDLKDTTNSLKGSGVERLNTSVSLLTQGFADFDADKIKTGFKGIGAAMSAIPIILIIEGIKALIDNFDEIIKFFRVFTGYIDENAKAVEGLTHEIKLQEAANITLISSIENEISILEAQGVATDKIIEKKKELVAAQVSENDKSIELSKAKIKQIQEESTIYEEAKAGVLNALGFQVNAIKGIVDAEKNRADRIAEENKNIAQSEAETSKLKTGLTVQEIENKKKLLEKSKEKAKAEAEIAKEAQARDAEIQNAEIDREEKRIKDSLDRQKKAGEMSVDIEKEIFANLDALELKRASNKVDDAKANLLIVQRQGGELLDARLQLLNAERDQELSNTELSESQKAEIKARYAEAEYQIRLKTQAEELQSAGAVASSLGELSNSLFDLKRSNLEKGSQEDKEAAEKQFNTNKAFSIATALISGAVAVVNASASVPYLPVGLAASISASVATAASVAKISSQKFQYFDGGYTTKGNPHNAAQSIGNSQFHNNEYVIPDKVLSTPKGSLMAAHLESMRTGTNNFIPKTKGFFDGGFTNRAISRDADVSNNLQNTIETVIKSMPPTIARISDIDRVNKSKENSMIISGL
jgi:hypothetical protein